MNPSSIILSAVMMLDYMGWHEAGRMIEDALERLFQKGVADGGPREFMPDGTTVGTKLFGEKIIEQL